jgi:hypothetical protein
MTGLAATLEPSGEPRGEVAVVLRITNTSDVPVEVPDPDLGVPSPAAGWSHSVAAYRASLLMSFGMLSVSVRNAHGEGVEERAVSTWSTPFQRPDRVLARGDRLDVVIPLAPLFAVEAGGMYRVTVAYGPARAEGNVEAV